MIVSAKLKQRLTLVIKISVAILLIAFLVKSGQLDPKDLWALMTVRNVAGAFVLIGVNLLIAAWRWIVLLRSRDFKITLFEGFKLYLIGVFFNHALPGAVGGDVVRGYYLVADNPNRRMDSVLSILIDRVLGLYSFFILTLFAAALDFEFVTSHDNIRAVALACLIVFAGMTGLFTVVFSSRLSALCGLGFFERRLAVVHRVVQGFQRFGRDRRVILSSVLVSLLSQVTMMFYFYELAVVMGESSVTLNAIAFAVPMGFVVTALPIAPAGIGVGQWAFLYLFQAYTRTQTQFGATAITAFQLTLLAWGLVGAVVYLQRGKPRAAVNDSARENFNPAHG